MRRLRRTAAIGTLWLVAAAAVAQRPALFQITTTHLPPPEVGKAYHVQLVAVGGTPPYHWAIVQGELPAGLSFDAGRGRIEGRPASAAAFSLLIRARDSAQPPLEVTRLLPASAAAPLGLSWQQVPALTGSTVAGSILVANASPQTLNVTVITVAVNAIGKAFALGYARLTLAPGAAAPAQHFSAALPPGAYTVHTDAVGEDGAGVIYRQRMEKPGLVVPPRP